MVPFTIQTLLTTVLLWTGWKQSAIPDADNGPSVRLDNATVTSVRNGSLEYFLGVPYAHPP